MEEVGSSRKVSLSEKVLAVEAGVVKEGSRILSSRRVRDLVTKVDVVEVDSKSCCRGGYMFLKQIESVSTSLRVSGIAVTGARGSGSSVPQ